MHLFRKNKWSAVSVAVILIIIFGFWLFHRSNGVETVKIKEADLVRVVKISGKIIPEKKVNLSFEIAGTVAVVARKTGEKVSLGDILVKLESGATNAAVKKAEAELASARAELDKFEGASIYENSVNSAKRSVNQAIRDAYTAASDSVQNKADQVFIDPLGSRPEISGLFDGHNDLREYLRQTRVEINSMLADWRALVDSLDASSYTIAQLSDSKKYLAKTIEFITNVSQAVNMFETTIYMTQSEINTYKANMLSARDNLNNASQGFIDVEKGFSQTLAEVPVQAAKVEAARAELDNLLYQLSKSTIYSPISGVISKQDAKIGQAVSAGSELVSVISADYLIETYVPEVSIAGIKVGDRANVTLDAYGPREIWEATVSHIDPAETLRDGVSTYKVELSFKNPDERVRSGLTANVEIEILRKPSVKLIPERVVSRENNEPFIYLWHNQQSVKIPVSLGERDSHGNIELLTEISSEDRVIVNHQK